MFSHVLSVSRFSSLPQDFLDDVGNGGGFDEEVVGVDHMREELLGEAAPAVEGAFDSLWDTPPAGLWCGA